MKKPQSQRKDTFGAGTFGTGTFGTGIEEKRIKPVIKWAGGKSSLLPQLLPLFPERYSRYVEPFLGGGAVFFSLRQSATSLLNDRNPELIELYATVRDFPIPLMAELDAMAKMYSEDFYYSLRKQTPETQIMRSARTILLNKSGFNGLYRQNSKGSFNVPFGKRERCPRLYDKENLLRASAALQHATLQSLDFENVIDQAEKGDFVYCDPPYEPLSPTSSFNTYQGCGFAQDHQRRLKDACRRAQDRGAFVVISNSSADFIKELYSDCDIRQISARRAINSKGNGRGEIQELAILLPPVASISQAPASVQSERSCKTPHS